MLTDRFSGRHTSRSDAAIAHFESGVLAVLGHRPGCPEALAAALAADPDLVAAHAVAGFGAVLLARPISIERAARHLAAARSALLHNGTATPFEQVLVNALHVACDGRLLGAAQLLEAHLTIHPHDLLVFKLTHALRFMGGDLPGLRRAALTVLPDWDENRPGFGFLLGCAAFAYEETADFAAAETAGRRAIELEPLDAWGLHAVAHVYEMQGRLAEGMSWLESTRQTWVTCNNFARHVAWHLALFHLEAGDIDATLAIYDAEVQAAGSEDFRDLANAVSMLWRLRQQGIPDSGRWEELAGLSRRRADESTLVFAALHHLLALLASEDRAGVSRVIDALRQRSLADDEQAHVAADVGLEFAGLIVAPARASADLEGLARRLPLVGGSNAQRDVFVQTLLMIAAERGDAAAVDGIIQIRSRCKMADRVAALAYQRLNSTSCRVVDALCPA